MKPFEELTNTFAPTQPKSILKVVRTPEKPKPIYTANENILISLAMT